MEIIEIPFGFIKEGKIYQSAWGENEDREIGEVRDENNNKSIQFFQERFADLESKVRDVTDKIDSTDNKGSFLMKLVHLREHLPQHDGLGDYPSLQEEIIKYENLVKDIIHKNRIRNTEIKSALLEEAKQIEEIVNWKEATEKVNDLKTRWIKTGSAEEGKNEELEESFWAAIKTFFDRKKQFFEDKQKLVEHRRRQYEELVEEAKKLVDLHGKTRFDKVKELKENWKALGGIPAEFYQPLNKAFNENLKGKKFAGTQIDYNKILEKLESVAVRKVDFNKEEIDKTKKTLFRDKRRSNEKSRCIELINLLNEREFIIKITSKRFPDFSKLDTEKKKSVRRGIIKDLISRDKDDLKIYEENSANFSTIDGKMNKMVENKINSQKKKIDIKSKLLEWVDEGKF